MNPKFVEDGIFMLYFKLYYYTIFYIRLAFLVILIVDWALNFSILILAVFFDEGDGLVVLDF